MGLQWLELWRRRRVTQGALRGHSGSTGEGGGQSEAGRGGVVGRGGDHRELEGAANDTMGLRGHSKAAGPHSYPAATGQVAQDTSPLASRGSVQQCLKAPLPLWQYL